MPCWKCTVSLLRMGLNNWTMNPKFPFNSMLIQRLLCASEGEDRLRLINALLPAVWHDGIDPTDAQAIGASLKAAGFANAADRLRSAQDAGVKQALMDNTQHAVDRGAFGIPTMFVGQGEDAEMFFGKERLDQVEAELIR